MPPLPTLVCKECGHVNEGERVYCHGCGVKLDREILVAQQKSAPTPEEIHREVKKIMRHGSGSFWKKTWRMLWKTVALSAIAAVIISAVLPPEWVTPEKKEDTLTPQIDAYLEKLLASPAGQRIRIDEPQVNAYLKRERFKKVPAWLTNWLPLNRAFVNFSPGEARITLQASLAGYPLYVGLTGRLEASSKSGLTGVCTGGFVGRLSLPPEILQQVPQVLPILLSSFQRERQMLGEIGSVEVGDKYIVLGSRGPAPLKSNPASWHTLQ